MLFRSMTSSFSSNTVGLFVCDGTDDGCEVVTSDGVAVGDKRVNEGTAEGILEGFAIVGASVNGVDDSGDDVEGGNVAVIVGVDVTGDDVEGGNVAVIVGVDVTGDDVEGGNVAVIVGVDVTGGDVEGGNVTVTVGVDVTGDEVEGGNVAVIVGGDVSGTLGANDPGSLGAGLPGTDVGLGLSPKSMDTSVW